MSNEESWIRFSRFLNFQPNGVFSLLSIIKGSKNMFFNSDYIKNYQDSDIQFITFFSANHKQQIQHSRSENLVAVDNDERFDLGPLREFRGSFEDARLVDGYYFHCFSFSKHMKSGIFIYHFKSNLLFTWKDLRLSRFSFFFHNIIFRKAQVKRKSLQMSNTWDISWTISLWHFKSSITFQKIQFFLTWTLKCCRCFKYSSLSSTNHQIW